MMPVAKPTNTTRLNLSLDLRLVVVILLLVILAMLLAWRPWQGRGAGTDRTVAVTGQATLTAEPDEYVFYPTYQFKHTDKATALAELSKKSDEVIASLKGLGVADKQIKTTSGGYSMPVDLRQDDSATAYSLQLTITVASRDQAQKVQTYLVSTNPEGNVSPQANFSDAKRKALESQARDQATKDARAKAEQSARNLGFKLGKVKTVSDGAGFGIEPYIGAARDTAASSKVASPELSVQPGENELQYSVSVTFMLK